MSRWLPSASFPISMRSRKQCWEGRFILVLFLFLALVSGTMLAFARMNLTNTALVKAGRVSETADYRLVLRGDVVAIDRLTQQYRQLALTPFLVCTATHRQAIMTISQGKPKEAENALREAETVCRNYPPYHWELGWAHWLQGHREKALAEWKQVGASNYFRYHARDLLSMGKTSLAIDRLTLAIEVDPREPRAYLELARLYEAEGRKGEAVQLLRSALQILPTDWYLRIQLGDLLLYDPGRCIPCAIEQYKLALLNPVSGDPSGVVHLARALHLDGHSDEALRVLDAVPLGLRFSEQVRDLYEEIQSNGKP